MDPYSLFDYADDQNAWPNRREEFIDILVEKGLKYLAINVHDSFELDTVVVEGTPIEKPSFSYALPLTGDLEELVLFSSCKFRAMRGKRLLFFKDVDEELSEEKVMKLEEAREGLDSYVYFFPDVDEEETAWFDDLEVNIMKIEIWKEMGPFSR